jgi:hypothetical protein
MPNKPDDDRELSPGQVSIPVAEIELRAVGGATLAELEAAWHSAVAKLVAA